MYVCLYLLLEKKQKKEETRMKNGIKKKKVYKKDHCHLLFVDFLVLLYIILLVDELPDSSLKRGLECF